MIHTTSTPDASINDLFDVCDTRGRGWLDMDDLRHVAVDIDQSELKHIFTQMDINGDGVSNVGHTL